MAAVFLVLVCLLIVAAVALASRADAALVARRVAASNIARLDRQEN